MYLRLCILLITSLWYLPSIAQADTTIRWSKIFSTNKSLQSDKFQSVNDIYKVQAISKDHKVYHHNEYYFYKKNDKRSLAYIQKTAAYILYDDTMYVNSSRLGLGVGFNKVWTSGQFWAIQTANPVQDNEHFDIKYNNQTGHFEADTSKKVVRQYMYYALDTKSFQLTALTFAGMLKILNAYPNLQLQFVKDKYNDDPFVILAYVQELNRYIKYFENKK